MASSLLAGWLLERGGSAAPYLAGGVGALLLLVLFPRWLPPLEAGAASAGIPKREG
jgi:hypothetical protein